MKAPRPVSRTPPRGAVPHGVPEPHLNGCSFRLWGSPRNPDLDEVEEWAEPSGCLHSHVAFRHATVSLTFKLCSQWTYRDPLLGHLPAVTAGLSLAPLSLVCRTEMQELSVMGYGTEQRQLMMGPGLPSTDNGSHWKSRCPGMTGKFAFEICCAQQSLEDGLCSASQTSVCLRIRCSAVRGTESLHLSQALS